MDAETASTPETTTSATPEVVFGSDSVRNQSRRGNHKRASSGHAAISNSFVHQEDEQRMLKVVIDGDDGGVDMRQAHERIDGALRIRSKYKKETTKLPPEAFARFPNRVVITQENGIYQVSNHNPTQYYALPTWSEFVEDLRQLRFTVSSSTCVRACTHRLGIMQERSRMFFLHNAEKEEKHNLRKAGGVFSKVTKVDCGVVLSKCVDAQELLDCVVDTCSRTPDAPIRLRDGTNATLRELFHRFGVTDPNLLTVEGLGWQPHCSSNSYTTANRVDEFPLSQELRFVFLSVRGTLSGRLLKRVFERAASNNQAAEYALPIFSTYPKELADIAKTLQSHGIGAYARTRYILQLRLFHPAPVNYLIDCNTVQDQLDNLFLPLFKATVAPSVHENAPVAWLLRQIGAMQLEGLMEGAEKEFDPTTGPPDSVSFSDDINALYYLYYLYANLRVLNSLRRRKGLNIIHLRCRGSHLTGVDDVLGGYMLCDVIARATKLRHYPVLQYLSGLHGVGMTVSPLRDHLDGTVSYRNNPLPNFLHRCFKVTVSTEAPLHFHHSTNPLVEEYATAQKTFRLSALDMTELAHNSVTISSFPETTKQEWLGDRYGLGVAGNVFQRSQVTNARLAFREESWQLERNMLRDMYLNIVLERSAGVSRWHQLSNVQEVEYNTVLDSRIRFPRTVLSGPMRESKGLAASPRIARALDLRRKYIWKPPNPWEALPINDDIEADFQRKTDTFNEDEWTYAGSDAVFIFFPRNAVHAWPPSLPTIDDFHKDLNELREICASPEVKEFSHMRLENLEHKFRLHLALNHANEAGTTEERASSNSDIYQATKVDTHIHMAAGMTPKQILQFVLKKYRSNGSDIAMKKGDDIITLGQLFGKAGITENLTVDQLSVQADHTLFERFDNFNNKYNPMENSELRSLLLKTDNFMNGRYFAEIVHDVFNLYSQDRYTYAENRVSVYGISIREWDKLAQWFTTHGMTNKHNKWIIQVPRVYKVFRGQNVIGSFGQYLQNIFQPLWEASLHPSEHPTLHNFLKHVSGFDSVDNEATIDIPFTPTSPWAWTSVENPPYNYYLYYLYANIRTLNEFRAARGFSTFSLRPHCGESGSDEHLYGAFLCANSICHGINLRNDPPMQYLYYLAQIGLHVSPLSNNALFLRFLNNPFPEFFRRGLNVSLSTDDPMMFHQTQEPLIEEYSIAARVWGLSPNDLCEIARNSVLQCGFGYDFKRAAIGDRWFMSSSLGNNPLRTHLSDIRVAFRFETYHTEVQNLDACSNRRVERFILTAEDERDISEQNRAADKEQITLSTHDQAMEVMMRDMENMREQIRVAKMQAGALRRQQGTLIDNITEVGILRQKLLEEEERDAQYREGVSYERDNKVELPTFETAESETVKRLLRWRPMPPNALRHITQKNFSLQRSRPLPPINAETLSVSR